MKALLVIDMLEDFFDDGLLFDQRAGLAFGINELISWARGRKIPIIWVRQEFAPDLSDAFLAMKRRRIEVTIAGFKGSQILAELDQGSEDLQIVKKRFSAFFKTELETLLTTRGVNHLILAGVNTHACIRMTAIDAYQRDMDVTIVEECVSSNDTEHHDVTLRYLKREIANLITLKELIRQ